MEEEVKVEEIVEEKQEENFNHLKDHFPLYFDIGEKNMIEAPICKTSCKKCWGKGYVKGKSNGKLKYKYPLINNTGEEVIICQKSYIVGIDLKAYSEIIAEKKEEN